MYLTFGQRGIRASASGASFVSLSDQDLGAYIAPEVLESWLASTSSAPGYQNVTLAWDANTEPDLAGYHAYRGEVSGGPYVRLTGPPQTYPGYVDTPPSDPAVTPFYYVVTAVDLLGNESAFSEEQSTVTGPTTKFATHNATCSVVATHRKTPQISRLATETPSPTAVRQARIARNATETPVATQTSSRVTSRSHGASSAPSATHLKQANISRSVVSVPVATHARLVTLRRAHAATATGVATQLRQPQIVRASTATGVGAHAKRAEITRGAAEAVVATYAGTLSQTRIHSVVVTGVATSSRVVGKVAGASATGAASRTLRISKSYLASSAAAPTQAAIKTFLRTHSASSTVVPNHARVATRRITNNASSTALATALRQVGRVSAASSSAIATHLKRAGKVSNAVGTAVSTSTAIKTFLRTHSALATAVASASRRPSKIHNALGIVVGTDALRVAKSYTAVAAPAASMIKLITKTHSRTSTPTATHSALRAFLRTFSTTSTAIATSRRTAAKVSTAQAAPAATQRKDAFIRVSTSSGGIGTHTPQRIAPPRLVTHNAQANVVAFRALEVGRIHNALAVGIPIHTTYATVIAVQAPVSAAQVIGGRPTVRLYQSPRAAVGTEGDYGGIRVYSRNEKARVFSPTGGNGGVRAY